MTKIQNQNIQSKCCKATVRAADENGQWAYQCTGCGAFCDIADVPSGLSTITKETNVTDTILGGKVEVDKDGNRLKTHKVRRRIDKANIETPESETITVTDPITKKTRELTLSRRGTTEESFAMTLLDKNADQQTKDTMLASYLFGRGKENASFMAEIMVSKGQWTKDTHAFKSQMKFDFDQFAQIIVSFLQDTSQALKKDANSVLTPDEIFNNLAERVNLCATAISVRLRAITEARMASKGFGVFIDRNGKLYSPLDKEIFDIIEEERKFVEENKDKVDIIKQEEKRND